VRVALVTCRKPIERDPDPDFIAPALRRRDAVVETPVWSDPAVDWATFDLAMLSSTWDYHERVDEFRAWLRAAAAATVVVNPPALVEWNLDKRYLRDIEAAGVPTVPTVWVEPGRAADAAAEIGGRGWETVVIKPVVDLGARNLVRVDAGQVERMLGAYDGTTMTQPYVGSVGAAGELSAVFVAGELSHSLRRLPARGDFRVEPAYGGTHEAVELDDEVREVAIAAVAAAPGEPLYARVDTVAGDDGPAVIGLELIEPVLYLDVAPPAAGTIAAQLIAMARR